MCLSVCAQIGGEHLHVNMCKLGVLAMWAWEPECASGHCVGGLSAEEHSCFLGMECCSCLLPKASVSIFVFLKKSSAFGKL